MTVCKCGHSKQSHVIEGIDDNGEWTATACFDIKEDCSCMKFEA